MGDKEPQRAEEKDRSRGKKKTGHWIAPIAPAPRRLGCSLSNLASTWVIERSKFEGGERGGRGDGGGARAA